MAKVKHAPACYPQVAQEYHVVTSTGKVVFMTDTEIRAWDHPGVKNFGFDVIIVTTVKCKAERPPQTA